MQLRTARLIYEARSRCAAKPNPAPFLRLRGVWLRRAGFDIGDDVTIEVQPGMLIIRKVSA